jgi:hypothetical protein
MKQIDKIFTGVLISMFSLFLLSFTTSGRKSIPKYYRLDRRARIFDTHYGYPQDPVKTKYFWASMVTKDTLINGRPAIITYDQNNLDSNLLIVWWPGEGEINANKISGLRKYGPHYYIDSLGTWDGSVVYDGKTFHPVIVSFLPFAGGTYFDPTTQKPAMDIMRSRFKVKKNGVAEIDISQGSQYADGQAGYQPTAGDHSYNDGIRAIVCIQGNPYAKTSTFGGERKYPYMYVDWVVRGGKMLMFEQDADGGRDEAPRATKMDSAVVNSATRYICHYGTGAHGSFPTFTDPTAVWNTSKSGVVSRSHGTVDINTNVYTWMISKLDTSTNTSGHIAPTANAGFDQTITLPVSTGNLDASASFVNGDATSITTYAWSKISGPSTFTITDATLATTTATGLVAGVYVFRVTITDNNGLTGTDDVQITVVASSNIPPVVSAGSDQTIILPQTSIFLTGTASDPDGTIASRGWSLIAGGSVIFSSTTTDTVTVSGLSPGLYTLQFGATDNGGAFSFDQMQLRVINKSSGTDKTSKVSMTLNMGYYDSTWQRWKPDSALSFNLVRTDGTNDGWTVQLAGYHSPAIANSSLYASTITGLKVPWQALNNYAYGGSNGIMTVTFSNLDPNKLYTIKSAASISVTSPARKVKFKITTTNDSAEMIAGNNYANEFTAINLVPSLAGQLAMKVSPSVGYPSAYFDYLIITEQGAAQNTAPNSDAGSNKIITLPLDSVFQVGHGDDPNNDPITYLWTIVGPGGSNPIIANSDSPRTWITHMDSAGLYTLTLKVTDTAGASSSSTATVQVVNPFGVPAIAAARRYFTQPLAQKNGHGPTQTYDTTFAKLICSTGPNALTIKWTQLAGPNTVTFTDPTNDTTRAYNLIPGEYQFRVTAKSLSDSASDTVQVRVKDFQRFHEHGCRVGAPHVYIISGTSTTQLVYQQLAETIKTIYGEYPQGGDTIKVQRNHVNNGIWDNFFLGGIMGCDGRRIIICPLDSVVNVGTVRLGYGSDSSGLTYCNLDGKLNKVGAYYGFQIDWPVMALKAGMAWLFGSNDTVRGWYTRNAATGHFVKNDQDTTRPLTWWNNWRWSQMCIDDCMVDTTQNGEGGYYGDTNPNGLSNNTTHGIPSTRMDTFTVMNSLFRRTYRDGFQISAAMVAKEINNWFYDVAYNNEATQRFTLDWGGTYFATILYNVVYGGKDGFGGLGHGHNDITWNWIVKQITNNVGGSKGIPIHYFPESCCGNPASVMLENTGAAADSATYNIDHNIIEYIESGSPAISVQDLHGSLKKVNPGNVSNNLLVDSLGRSVSTLISNVSGSQYNTNNFNFIRQPIQIFDLSTKLIGPKFLLYDPVNGHTATFTKASDAVIWRYTQLQPSGVPGANNCNCFHSTKKFKHR